MEQANCGAGRVAGHRPGCLSSQSRQFVADGRRADGSPVDVSVRWNATGGTIDSTGKFVAGKTVGAYRVVATQLSGALTDTARVTVTQTGPTPGPTPTPQSVVLTPATVSVQPGGKTKFSATVKMSDSTTSNVAVSTYSATGGSVDSTGTYTAGRHRRDLPVDRQSRHDRSRRYLHRDDHVAAVAGADPGDRLHAARREAPSSAPR